MIFNILFLKKSMCCFLFNTFVMCMVYHATISCMVKGRYTCAMY